MEPCVKIITKSEKGYKRISRQAKRVTDICTDCVFDEAKFEINLCPDHREEVTKVIFLQNITKEN